MWYQQQLTPKSPSFYPRCDLLKNIYLCGINNNEYACKAINEAVVICLKISIFVVSTTTITYKVVDVIRCDLLKNIYLCGINNNLMPSATL
nr:hypothetical protein [Segatella oulorum]